ncbi:MAG: terminase TerL endonuclease subunit [Pseudomonadota bacterium]
MRLPDPKKKKPWLPLILEDFQKKFIRDVYEPHMRGDGADWRRGVRRAILSIARKNGKTALIAALVLVHLIGPEAILFGEIYSAANDREQAAQVFKFVKQYITLDPELSSALVVTESTKTVASMATSTKYQALSAEAGTKHGLSPSVWIFDELAQAKKRDLFDALDTAQGARDEPLGLVISTQSPDPQHPLSLLIDDGLRGEDPTIVAHLHAVPDEVEDIFDESYWPLANPALGTFRDREDMRAAARRASRMPSFEPAFRNLNLNQRVDEQAAIIPRTEWNACIGAPYIADGEQIFAGLDLSATTDLTALVAVSAFDGDRINGWYWKPGDTLKEHAERDRAPYVEWRDQGFLEAPPGRAVDYEFVAHKLCYLRDNFDLLGVAYDSWRIENLRVALTNLAIPVYVEGKDDPVDGAIRLVRWVQGFAGMSPAIEALEVAVLERLLVHGNNPALNFCVANAIAKMDPAGNRMFDKQANRFRIDGAVAMAMAIGLKRRDNLEPEEDSYSAEHGVEVL